MKGANGPLTDDDGRRRPVIDYCRFDELLTDDERAAGERAREFVDRDVRPIIAGYYERGEFPRHLIPQLIEIGVHPRYRGLSQSPVARGLVCQELERGDSALRSFASVQSSLSMFAIDSCGSRDQRERFLPAMARGEIIGCFALTEPDHGSDPAAMETIAERESGGYVLRGHKRWATNATTAGVAIIWAKCDGAVRGFLVEAGTPGFEVRPIHQKMSLRVSMSAEILLNDCRIPAENALPGATGLVSALKCLNEARFDIVWGSLGAGMDSFEAALAYAGRREQFGRPIAGFQLTQNKLVDMYSELTKARLLALRLGRLKENGRLHHSQVSLGKRNSVRTALDACRTARTIFGAAGVTDDCPAMRHAANLESVLTYEGTEEIHTLIVGQDITGLEAFR